MEKPTFKNANLKKIFVLSTEELVIDKQTNEIILGEEQVTKKTLVLMVVILKVWPEYRRGW